MKICLKEELNIEAYKETINIDIKILTQLKRGTKLIQNDGEKSTKLYKNMFLMKLTFFRVIYEIL